VPDMRMPAGGEGMTARGANGWGERGAARFRFALAARRFGVGSLALPLVSLMLVVVSGGDGGGTGRASACWGASSCTIRPTIRGRGVDPIRRTARGVSGGVAAAEEGGEEGLGDEGWILIVGVQRG